MTLEPAEIESWPPLAWVARVDDGATSVRLAHGPHVEVRPGWAVEGVWAGPFEDGGFDRTALVFGSGVRCRGDTVIFVSAGSNVDRLWHTCRSGARYVSNSLPALLACSGARLSDEVPDYSSRLCGLLTSVGTGSVEVPAQDGTVGCVYHHNLAWDGRRLEPVAKPSTAPRFDAYETYRDFLLESGAAVGANATSGARDRPMDLLTTVTGGYDSTASSVVAREAGCRRAATIRSARSVVPRSDSGREVAESLGLDCREYPRAGRDHPDELTFWAAVGSAQDANLAIFDYGSEPSVLFSGIAGGRVWPLDINDLGVGLLRGDWNGLGFTEFRVWQGVVHVPVPFFGARRTDEIFRLSHAEEMEPWILGGDYDRPVPRRIAEEAGVPREAFGMKKNATMFEESFLWPRGPELQRRYREYLERAGASVPPVRLGRLLGRLEQNVLFPIRSRVSSRATPARIWPSSRRLLFQWANHELARKLEAGLERRRADPKERRPTMHEVDGPALSENRR